MSPRHALRSVLLATASVLFAPVASIASGQDTVAATAAEELLEAARKAGPWKVARLRERDGIRNGPDYRGGTIHYPTAADGAIADAGPLPIVAICPGYQASEGSVRPWGDFLASHGIVVMTLGTNAPRDLPIARGRALLDAIETVRAEHTREDSPLHGRLDLERTGVAGWSMGGGGAQHAAVMDDSLKGVVAWVPWQPGIAFKHAVPVMILAGEKDRIASTRAHSRPHFERTPDSTTKLLFEIRGGNHFLPSNPGNHDGDVGAWTLAWIKAFVAGDEAYRSVLEREPSTASIYELSRGGEATEPERLESSGAPGAKPSLGSPD